MSMIAASSTWIAASSTGNPSDGIIDVSYEPSNNLPMIIEDMYKQHLNQQQTALPYLINYNDIDINNVVTASSNQNLTQSQKHLLRWHQKLGHLGFQWVQTLLRKRQWFEDTIDEHGKVQSNPTYFLPINDPKAASCEAPLCAACRLLRMTTRATKTKRSEPLPDKYMALQRDDIQPGDVVSLDHYQSSIKGRLPNSRGREKDHERYCGGTIGVDHASSYMFHRHQVTLRAHDTVKTKQIWEHEARQCGIDIKQYHSDNGIFVSDIFIKELERCNQTLTLSGGGAHHQNGIAERAIRTTVELARTMLIHAAMHWPEETHDNLWPFALSHAIYIYIHTPNITTGISPIEHFTGARYDCTKLLKRLHVWGAPCYVLEPTLQDGHKLPKWKPSARRGQYLGISLRHSSQVGLIRILKTHNISPQFHVTYDDDFQTIASPQLLNADNIDSQFWQDIIKLNTDNYLDHIHPDDLPQLPTLDKEWSDTHETHKQVRYQPPPTAQPSTPPLQVSEGVPEGAPGPQPANDDVPDLTLVSPPSSREPSPEPTTRRSSRSRTRNPRYFNDDMINTTIPLSTLNDRFLASINWATICSTLYTYSGFQFLNNLFRHTDPETDEIEHFPPTALQTVANAADNPRWEEAVNGPHAEHFREAMDIEHNTLRDFDSWDVVDREPHMNVLSSVWAFKIKRYPDGRVKKYKARFCVRGFEQIEGVDYFETYAPVVSWITVRILLILSVILNLSTTQVDYTCAFLHAPVTDDIYVETPKGYQQKGKVLKLKRSLYGLKQAPRNFYLHLKQALLHQGFHKRNFDEYLFIDPKLICITYVDDCLFFSRDASNINEMIDKLKADSGLAIEYEEDVAGFLGVLLQKNDDGTITLSQSGLINRIIEATYLKGASTRSTPANPKPLYADKDGEPTAELFNYASVIGMLTYLAGHSRPDIAFAVHQCARFTFNPRRSYEEAVKHIVRHLIGTKDQGLIINPSNDLSIELFVDADFAGLWAVEDKQDPNSVRSRTGFTIMIGNTPVIWQSKLQSEISLSTFESEYIALSTALRDLIPLKNLLTEISLGIGLCPHIISSINSTIWEDNAACEKLANLEPPRMTPRSK